MTDQPEQHQIDDSEFLQQYNASEYPAPLVTVDVAIFSWYQDQLCLLLVERSQPPQQGVQALPGGFIDIKIDQSPHDCALRKLRQKTGATLPYLEQVATIGGPDRDPRGWAMTVLYFALMPLQAIELDEETEHEPTQWAPVERLSELKLAFDHQQLATEALNRLRNKADYTDLALRLLPESFTLTEAQQVSEAVTGRTLEKKSFRRRLLAADIVEETGEERTSGRRPAKLYRLTGAFDKAHLFNRGLG